MSASPASPPRPGGLLRCILAGLLLAVALAFAGRTVYSALHPALVDAGPAVALLTSPDDIASAPIPVGTFATGSNPGDRRIVIATDHTVRFSEIGPKADRYDATDVIRPAHRDGALYLATKANGPIEVLDNRSLRYFDDVYRRTN